MHDSPDQRSLPPEPATLPFAPAGNDAAALVGILERYLDELKAGQQPDREKLLAEHPHLRQQLEACLAGLDFIHHSDQRAPKQMGDFRILREIGRGGMGAVYEAEQISLGRRVALKIMRFTGLTDIEAEERFQREAETVARLHHTNIVPIFTVGQEQGINYYAMQYIEGHSLATVLEDAGAPIDSTRVAQWGLQVAEALAHAHQRGIIHRDVKPSNLLIDTEGRIWLTDFGLAKRSNDVTLSMTGALLGTPRYMSPEQASASNRTIDYRTDIYSLGAALYELATRQPVFQGDSPHNVICQIVADDPTPARQHVPAIPLDLDTILMKCLSKDPDERYSSAQELANDLRAFLEGRSITARRPSITELAARWLKRQQRSVILAGSAVAATILLLVGSIAGWFVYDQWRRSFVSLTTNTPPLFVEVMHHGHDDVLLEETVPTRQPIALPAGEYDLRVSGKARISQTYRVDLQRAHRNELRLQLDDQLLWSHVEAPRMYYVLRRPSGKDVLLFDLHSLTLVNGRTGKRSWDCNVVEYARTHADPRIQNFGGLVPERFYGTDEQSDATPWLADGLCDADQDGDPDVILAGRISGWLLAISHATGQPLWMTPRAPTPGNGQQNTFTAVSSPPVIVGDLDNDQVNDMIVSLLSGDNYDASKIERWVELVSGKSGTTLWKYTLSNDWFQLPQSGEVPLGLRVRLESGGSGSGGSFSSWSIKAYTRGRSYAERYGQHRYKADAPIPGIDLKAAANGSPPVITFVAGQQIVQLDAATGQEKHTLQALPVRPTYPTRWADLDGDHCLDVLAVEEVPMAGSGKPDRFGIQLTAWSAAKQELLWQRTLSTFWPRQCDHGIPAATWPVLADLDGDGASEVLVPNDSTAAVNNVHVTPSQKLEAIDGRTGKPLWSHMIRTMDQQVDHFVVGPDIDADGIRDVFAASMWGYEQELYVDAISGKDGRLLWLTHQRVRDRYATGKQFYVRMLHCWQRGGDAVLLVMAQPVNETYDTAKGFAITANSGRWLGELTGATEFRSEDFDADGLDELLMVQQNTEYGMMLDCLRGQLPERWRRLGGNWAVAADYDQDGIRDWLATDALAAMSGATGDILWRSDERHDPNFLVIDPTRATYFFHRSASLEQRQTDLRRHCDLNGDRVPDVLASNSRMYSLGTFFSPLVARSGKTGRILWNADIALQGVTCLGAFESRDLDGDGRPEIVYVIGSDFEYPLRTSGGTQEAQLRVFVLDGATGKQRWNQPLSAAYGKNGLPGFPYYLDSASVEVPVVCADINRDQYLDVIVPAETETDPTQWELRAFDGRSGNRIWQTPLPDLRAFGSNALGAIGRLNATDVNVDGIPDIVALVMSVDQQNSTKRILIVQAMSGMDGAKLWQWQTPDNYSINPNRPQGGPTNMDWLQQMQVTVARSPAGPNLAINVYHWDGQDSHLAILNAKGEQIADRIFRRSQRVLPIPYDIDADGVDELIYADLEQVQAVRSDNSAPPIWQISLAGPIESLQLLPAAAGNKPVLAALDTNSASGSVYGIDPTTGRALWSSPAAGVFDILGDTRDNRPPLIGIQNNMVTLCRGATIAVAAGQSRDDEIFDPRTALPLPWADQYGVNAFDNLAFVGWGFYFCMVVVVIPGIAIRTLLLRGRFSLRVLLLSPLFVALLVMGAMVKTRDPDTVLEKIGTGVLFVPVIVFLVIMFRHLTRGRLGKLLLWCLVWLLLGALIASLLFVDGGSFADGETYSLKQWYWPLIPAIYVTGVLMAIVALIQALGRWRRIRKRQATQLTISTSD